MSSITRFAVVALFVSLVAGCIPEKRIAWSPDGQRAAVTTPKGIFLIDADGKVLDSRVTGSAARCDWFRDGHRLAVAYGTKAKTWNEIAGVFTPEQIEEIHKLAATVHDRLLTYEGDWDHFEIDPENKYPGSMEIAALVYMRENRSEGLPEKLGAKWDEAKSIEPDLWQLQVFTLGQDKLAPGTVILRTLDEIAQPRVSPNGKNIAFIKAADDEKEDTSALHVVPVDGGAPRLVAKYVAADYDWSPDGCGLAYIHCTVPRKENAGNVYLGSLATVRVAQPDGALLKQWEQQTDKVGLLFNEVLCVRWLSDGRLLFTSAEVTLPATEHDMPQRWSLFTLDPRTPASVCRVVRRDFDQPIELSTPTFVLSPDEKQVLLPATGGRTIQYSFSSGEGSLLPGAEDSKSIRSLPCWRTPSEVCYVRLLETQEGSQQGVAEVVLLKDKTPTLISVDWPEEMKDGWLIGQ